MAAQFALPDWVAPSVSQMQSEFGVNLENIDMWFAEPPIPAQEAPVYIAAKASAPESQKKERILGICSKVQMVEKNKEYLAGNYSYYRLAVGFASDYMKHYENKPNFFGDGSRTTMRVVQQPTYGRLDFIRDLGYGSGFETLDSAETEFNAKGLGIDYIVIPEQ